MVDRAAGRHFTSDPATWHPDGQAKARSIARAEAAVERERIVMELFLAGARFDEIGRAIGRSGSQANRILHRALERRAAEEGPTYEAAKAIYVDRLSMLLNAHLPMALGTYRPKDSDGEEGDPIPPSVQAGEFCLKVIDRLAAVQGKMPENDKPGELHLHLHGEQGDMMRQDVLASLDQLARKNVVIEGSLADANTSLDRLRGAVAAIEDKPMPPGFGEAA